MVRGTPKSEMDFNGPPGSAERYPVNTEDYVVRANVSGETRTREAKLSMREAHKRKDLEELGTATHMEHINFGDDHFKIGARSGHTRNAFTVEGHAAK